MTVQNDSLVEVLTPECPVCRAHTVLMVDPVKLQEWKQGGLIQKVFPEWTEDQRELLKSGIHAGCWDALLLPDEDDDDDDFWDES